MRIGKFIFRFVLAIILISIAAPLLWLSLAAFESNIVLFQAKRIAGERPYCIVVSDKFQIYKYKAVSNRSDLAFSALTTRLDWGGSGGPYAENYYSLLLLKNPDEIRNWSKRYLNWERDVEPTQESLFHKDLIKLCTPIVDFSRTVH